MVAANPEQHCVTQVKEQQYCQQSAATTPAMAQSPCDQSDFAAPSAMVVDEFQELQPSNR